jgi:xylan 1,4-beta-xylosidase
MYSLIRISSVTAMLAFGFNMTVADNYSITVDAGQRQGEWNRFYEKAVATCHMVSILHTSYGRNIKNALAKAHEEAGFTYFRGHGIFNGDIGLYSESGGTVSYNWSKFDSVYDAARAAGMYPILEFSHMPPALASGTGTVMWYNGASGNVTQPKDYGKWRDLIRAVVEHCEQRYGVDEVRNIWYFEVWNEPDLMLSASNEADREATYLKMYDYAAEGVRLADSLCRIGGPSISGCSPRWLDDFFDHCINGTNAATGTKGTKLDFITYHHYATDPQYLDIRSQGSRPMTQNEYHKAMVDIANKYNFEGEIINTEWASTAAQVEYHSDNESAGSFAAKTIHLLNSNGPEYPPPAAYSFWCLSDLYEENNAWQNGVRHTYEGNYGMLLRGDKDIPVSWDLAKPMFNVFRLLHKMGDSTIACTGGTTDNGVNAAATIRDDEAAIQILVYNHIDGGDGNSGASDNVSLTVNNIPFAPGPATLQMWTVDRTHCNSFRHWQDMGGPGVPSEEQWNELKTAADLVPVDSSTVNLSNGTFTKNFQQFVYGTTLLTLSRPGSLTGARAARALPPPPPPALAITSTGGGTAIAVTGARGNFDIAVFTGNGRLVLKASGTGSSIFAAPVGRAAEPLVVSVREHGAAACYRKIIPAP